MKSGTDQSDGNSATIEGASYEAGELVIGFLDVLVAFGVTLANAGLMTREEIAETMRRALAQQRRQPRHTLSREMPMAAMEKFFAQPLMEGGRGRAGLVPIKGGKDDDEPTPAA